MRRLPFGFVSMAMMLTACASSAPRAPVAVSEQDTSAPTASLRIRRPVATDYDPPVLTPDAMVAGVAGPAHVRCILLEDGLLYNCTLLQPIPMMDRAIKLALNGWHFDLATEAGKAVPVALLLAVPLVAKTADVPAQAASMLDAPRTTDRFQEGSTPPNGFREDEIGWRVVKSRGSGSANDPNVLVFRCRITTEGSLTKCRALKPHPMNDAVLAQALANWKYNPVVLHGKPVEVDYVITVRLGPPHKAAPSSPDGGTPDAALSSPDGG
jgi:hypothetical protein